MHLLMDYPPLRAGLLCAVPCICPVIAKRCCGMVSSHAEQCQPDCMQEASADTRLEIIRMLAEVIGHVTEPGRAKGSSDAGQTTYEESSCGPECASLAQQLLQLILELMGKASFMLSRSLLKLWRECTSGLLNSCGKQKGF